MTDSPRLPARLPDDAPGAEAPNALADAVLGVLGSAPSSDCQASPHPAEAARRAAASAASKAAAAAGTLALPPGPLGWLTVLPELLAVWRIQAQLVADIAALYGKRGSVTREQMLYCLFKHTAAQALRDFVVRAGERWLVRRATSAALQAAARRIGLHLTQKGFARAASRWLPVVGAAGVAAYAWYDTRQVARSAIELFSREVVIEGEAEAAAHG